MRTHNSLDINIKLQDQTVSLCGWVQARRDHGGVIFFDLRDHNEIVQITCHPEDTKPFEIAQTVRNEYVLQVTGVVKPRGEGLTNKKLLTGEIEVIASEIAILNTSAPLPLMLEDHKNTAEETKLKYRYLDIRRTEMTQRLKLRSKLNQLIRNYLQEHDFTEVETPCLTSATPEGARDYLVPSRNQLGKFYALPQSPQIFKQLLMVAGMERYYQIVRCFRDEDLRADRQPEFTQLDVEMSFINEEDIQQLMENMVRGIFKTLINVDLPNPFPQMTYEDAMHNYGNDRPDLRNPLKLIELSDVLTNVDFKVFSDPANNPEGRVAAICIPNGNTISRKQIDNYTKYVTKYGAKGLAYIKVNDVTQGLAGLQSPIVKFLTADIASSIIERCQANSGDIIFFGADTTTVVNQALGALRDKLGEDLSLLQSLWQPLWVIDFPMFEADDDNSWQALHHPFTAPQNQDPEALLSNPGNSLSRAYDMVINGSEVGGGSIRIHKQDMQQAVFKLLNISEQEAQDKFSHLLNALQYGCPPHGGIAFGLDRLAMILSDCKSIRDVIAFPKTQNGLCPLTNAPSTIAKSTLEEIGVCVADTKITQED